MPSQGSGEPYLRVDLWGRRKAGSGAHTKMQRQAAPSSVAQAPASFPLAGSACPLAHLDMNRDHSRSLYGAVVGSMKGRETEDGKKVPERRLPLCQLSQL